MASKIKTFKGIGGVPQREMPNVLDSKKRAKISKKMHKSEPLRRGPIPMESLHSRIKKRLPRNDF